MKTFLGIDFGTTQTVVTMIKEESRYEPQVVEIDGKNTVDTALRLDAEDNVVFFGERALEKIYEAPQETFYNFKVAIGTGKIFRSSFKEYRPETLALLFLKHLRQKIEKNYFNVTNLKEIGDLYCTIGCPAAWNEVQRRVIVNIAQEAGFPNVSCCDEPFGVIYYYYFRGDIPLKKPQNILVYDFGGGTTDVAIEEVAPDANGTLCGTPKVLAVAGMAGLGGKDFDERLRDHFIREMDAGSAVLGDKDIKTIERYARLIKEELSVSVGDGRDLAERTIPRLFSRRDSYNLTLPKQLFEELCGSFINQLENPVYDAFNGAALEAKQIDHVIIAGGSSRLYYVADRIRALFPRSKIVTSANPVEVIAKGLALYGRGQSSRMASETIRSEGAASSHSELKQQQSHAFTRSTHDKRAREKKKLGKKWWSSIVIIIALLCAGGGYVYFQKLKTPSVDVEVQNENIEPQVTAEERQTVEQEDDAAAQLKSGDIYYNQRNYPEAVESYRKAAEQGNAEAQYLLGRMYDWGRGVEQDYEQAREWYQKAAEAGEKRAKERLTEIKDLR
jgi:molecular chaperone DnaK (HSP70)